MGRCHGVTAAYLKSGDNHDAKSREVANNESSRVYPPQPGTATSVVLLYVQVLEREYGDR